MLTCQAERMTFLSQLNTGAFWDFMIFKKRGTKTFLNSYNWHHNPSLFKKLGFGNTEIIGLESRLYMRAKSKNVLRAGIKSGTQPGYFTCIFCKGTFEGDKRRVCCDNLECQKKQHERIKERAKRSAERNEQKKSTNNPCIICGRDKGVNRFYCKACHLRLSNEYGPEEYSANTQI